MDNSLLASEPKPKTQNMYPRPTTTKIAFAFTEEELIATSFSVRYSANCG